MMTMPFSLPAASACRYAPILAAVLFQATLPSFSHADDRVLPADNRTNGESTLDSLAQVMEKMRQSQVALGKSRDATLAATVLSEDGYIIAKASEAQQFKPWKIFLQDGSDMKVRLVRDDHELDLLLLKVERQGMQAIEWGQSIAVQAGQWLCALTGSSREIRLGVLSARTRDIPDSGVVLGVLMGADEAEDGVLIEEVAEDSPAQLAGLQANDLVVSVDGKKVTSNRMLNQMVNARRAGDVVKLSYLREGSPGECEVRLASRSRVMMNWAGEDFANGGTSVRTDSFPEIIQHEIPLIPADMGSAVYNIEGQVVGLNIARVNRVTTFALPISVFREPIEKWIKEDREKKLRQ